MKNPTEEIMDLSKRLAATEAKLDSAEKERDDWKRACEVAADNGVAVSKERGPDTDVLNRYRDALTAIATKLDFDLMALNDNHSQVLKTVERIARRALEEPKQYPEKVSVEPWTKCKCGTMFHLKDSPTGVCPDCRERESAKDPEPVCRICSDSHLMMLGERYVPCTHCPIPCEFCRVGPACAYCEKTPCNCACHKKQTGSDSSK